MSISKRDQRITIAEERDIGSNGRVEIVYVATAQCWGRIEAPTGATHALGTQLEHTADAVISVSQAVAIPENGMVIGPDGTWYRITAVLLRRAHHEWQILAVFADDAVLQVDYPGDIAITADLLLQAQGGQTFASDVTLDPSLDAAAIGGQLFVAREWFQGDAVVAPTLAITIAGRMTMPGHATLDPSLALDGTGGQLFTLTG